MVVARLIKLAGKSAVPLNPSLSCKLLQFAFSAWTEVEFTFVDSSVWRLQGLPKLRPTALPKSCRYAPCQISFRDLISFFYKEKSESLSGHLTDCKFPILETSPLHPVKHSQFPPIPDFVSRVDSLRFTTIQSQRHLIERLVLFVEGPVQCDSSHPHSVDLFKVLGRRQIHHGLRQVAPSVKLFAQC